jgi:molecular chaperone HscB
MMQTDECWRCGKEQRDSLFCCFCNTLQPPSQDYYRFLGLKLRLALDPADLQKRYYDLSRLVHPDRFQRGTPKEQRFALDATAILNDAYRTLRDPVARAEYVLKEEGVEVPPHEDRRVPPELLEEVFEANSAIEKSRNGDAGARLELAGLRDRFRALRLAADAELETLFRRFDAGGGKDALRQVRAVLDRRKFVANLIGELEAELV